MNDDLGVSSYINIDEEGDMHTIWVEHEKKKTNLVFKEFISFLGEETNSDNTSFILLKNLVIQTPFAICLPEVAGFPEL